MSNKLATSKREAFARKVAAGESQVGAYRDVYPSARTADDDSVRPRASRLANTPEVKKRIEELQDRIADELVETAANVKRELTSSYLEDIKAMKKEFGTGWSLQAIKTGAEVAKLLNLYPDPKLTIKAEDVPVAPPGVTQLGEEGLLRMANGEL